jgi:hypothetical protein
MNIGKKSLIPVDPRIVEMELLILESKLSMHRAKLHAFEMATKQTRNLVRSFIKQMVGRNLEDDVNAWASAQVALEDYEKAIINVAISELQRDLAVAKQLLEECKNEANRLIS